MPSLQSLHEDRAEDGVVVLGLSTDVGSERTIRDFLGEDKSHILAAYIYSLSNQ